MVNMKYTENQNKLIGFIKQSSDLEVMVMMKDLVDKALERLLDWEEYQKAWAPHSIISPNYIKQIQIDRVKYLGTQLDKARLEGVE